MMGMANQPLVSSRRLLKMVVQTRTKQPPSLRKNQRLKKIVADLELDKLILRESLDFLKPKG